MEHLEPVAVDFAGDLTSAYLRPNLRKDKVEDADKYLVWYDAAAAVTNPDEFGDALKLYEARAVGKAYLRRTGNAQETDAMTDEELQEALLVAIGQLVDVEGGQVVIEEPEPEPEVPPTGEETDPDMPVEPDDTEADPNAPNVPATATVDEFLVAVMAQAELALLDVRGRVGMRVRNALAGGKCAECVEAVKDVHASQIVAELGQDVIDSNGLDLARYAESAGDTFRAAAAVEGRVVRAVTGAAGGARVARRVVDLRPRARPAGRLRRSRAHPEAVRLHEYTPPAVVAAGPEVSTLAMVAVYPTAEQAEALAVEGGEAADSLHCTLVFLGEADGLDADAVTGAVAQVCSEVAPLEGTVGGAGAFVEGPDGVPVIALPDVKGLTGLREAIVAELRERGVESPSEYGFPAAHHDHVRRGADR